MLGGAWGRLNSIFHLHPCFPKTPCSVPVPSCTARNSRCFSLRGAAVTWLTFMMNCRHLGVAILQLTGRKDKRGRLRRLHVQNLWIGWIWNAALVDGVTARSMSASSCLTFHGKARWTTEAERLPFATKVGATAVYDHPHGRLNGFAALSVTRSSTGWPWLDTSS